MKKAFGLSTIFLAFSMLCIVTFSALALVTANSDLKLSKKVATKNKNYYSAEKRAYLSINEIDDKLLDIYQSSKNQTEYFDKCKDYLQTLDYGLIDKDNPHHFCFSESLSQNQSLNVCIEITYPQAGHMYFFKIVKWQNTTDSENTDETLNLIGSN